ncbi:MAG: DUF4282 domain-containing protein [Puniceicoccaceae bacterium]
MEDYLKFRKMITPLIIQIVFWIGVVVAVIAGLVQIFGGESALSGLLTILVGPIVVRIYCELLIVIFSINDTLRETRDLLRQRGE